MLSSYTENELWAHINHMRTVRWAAQNGETFEVICGERHATADELEALSKRLALDGLGELQAVVIGQLIMQIQRDNGS